MHRCTDVIKEEILSTLSNKLLLDLQPDVVNSFLELELGMAFFGVKNWNWPFSSTNGWNSNTKIWIELKSTEHMVGIERHSLASLFHWTACNWVKHSYSSFSLNCLCTCSVKHLYLLTFLKSSLLTLDSNNFKKTETRTTSSVGKLSLAKGRKRKDSYWN